MNDSFFTGLLQGFTGRKREVEKENIRQADLASEREQRVLMTLLQADDPEVRNLALSGLIDTAGPGKKAKGLGGWIGQRQQSPVFGQLQRVLQTPTMQPVEEQQTTLPSKQMTGGMAPMAGFSPTGESIAPPPTPQAAITTPPSGGGMAPTSPVQPGAPPPTPVSVTNAPPTPFSITRMALRPRQVFLSPAENYQRNAAAKEVGDIMGMRAGLRAAMPEATDAEISAIIRQKVAGRYALQLPYQSTMFEAPDGKGGYYQVKGSYDKRTGQYLDDSGEPVYGGRPIQHTASFTMGQDREWATHLLFPDKRAIDTTPEESRLVDQFLADKRNVVSTKDALTMADKYLPNATLDDKLTFADSLKAGTSVQTPSGPAAPGAAPTPTATPTAAPTAPGTPPPAPRKITDLAPPDLRDKTKEYGKPLPTQVQTAIARTRSMNDTVDKALAALEPYKNDTSLDSTVKLVAKYRAGTEGNPLAIDQAQLGDLAGLQQSASTTLGGASRSQRIYADKRQHTPRLPSGRQVMFATGTTGFGLPALGAERVNKISQIREGDPGGFDSPATMYLKLKNLKDLNDQFLRDIQETASGTRPVTSHGAPPTPASQPATPVLYRDAQGVWRMGTPPQ